MPTRATYPAQEETAEETEEVDTSLSVEINQNSGEMHVFKDGKDITPPGFGRIAAQTARQVILQQIREAEKKTIVEHYQDQVGTIVRGRVIRYEGRNISFDIGKAEGTLPQDEQIRREDYRLNDSYTLLIKEIREDNYGNSRIILSRAHPDLVKELFAKEVPEIASGTVKVHNVVREPGDRTKIAVHSDQPGVDPVGACVGQKGIRVKAVTDELGGMEKIDIIQYNADDELFIREALSPATVSSISLDKKKKIATVNVDEEQAPLAIGRNGVNVNLASKLTGYEINIEQMESEQAVEKEIDEAIDNEPQGDVDESTVVETELTEDVKAEEAVVAENEVVEAEAEETPQEEPTETENSEEKKEEETSA
jgi:N utilization substance protein A